MYSASSAKRLKHPDLNWKVHLLNPLAATQGHLSCGGVTAEKITVNPMSQTVIPTGILSMLQNLPSPYKTQSLLALATPRLWQIWFEKAGNEKKKKKIHRFSPSFLHIALAQSINLPKYVWSYDWRLPCTGYLLNNRCLPVMWRYWQKKMLPAWHHRAVNIFFPRSSFHATFCKDCSCS